MKVQRATFAAGCFWGVEQKFLQKFKDAVQTTVGYTGGKTQEPTYMQVCRGGTGHAEAVQVLYDPARIDYSDLVAFFYTTHNAAGSRGQGSQYRSAVFYHYDQQRAVAEEQTEVAQKRRYQSSPIFTELVPASTFWPAEEYHQKYIIKNGGGCH